MDMGLQRVGLMFTSRKFSVLFQIRSGVSGNKGKRGGENSMVFEKVDSL